MGPGDTEIVSPFMVSEGASHGKSEKSSVVGQFAVTAFTKHHGQWLAAAAFDRLRAVTVLRPSV